MYLVISIAFLPSRSVWPSTLADSQLYSTWNRSLHKHLQSTYYAQIRFSTGKTTLSWSLHSSGVTRVSFYQGKTWRAAKVLTLPRSAGGQSVSHTTCLCHRASFRRDTPMEEVGEEILVLFLLDPQAWFRSWPQGMSFTTVLEISAGVFYTFSQLSGKYILNIYRGLRAKREKQSQGSWKYSVTPIPTYLPLWKHD